MLELGSSKKRTDAAGRGLLQRKDRGGGVPPAGGTLGGSLFNSSEGPREAPEPLLTVLRVPGGLWSLF